jgi:hypothetical protein
LQFGYRLLRGGADAICDRDQADGFPVQRDRHHGFALGLQLRQLLSSVFLV